MKGFGEIKRKCIGNVWKRLSKKIFYDDGVNKMN